MQYGLTRSRTLYRLAGLPPVGYPLLLGWMRGWLPRPTGSGDAHLPDGRVLRCALSDRTQRTMFLGLYEPEDTALVRSLLAPGDTFVDVGAHIGWFTTIASRRVGDAGRVTAFEPYAANAAALRGNLDRNNCRNVTVLETALGSEPGRLTLARARGDSGGVTALDWARDGKIEAPMAALDDLTGDLGEVALIKIDVEGWEAHVLRGAPATLARTRRVLIEMNRPCLTKAGSSPAELTALLREAGFTQFRTVLEGGLRRLNRSPVSNVLATRPGDSPPLRAV